MSENKSKNIVIIALCITLIFMGVGFSLLSQQLTINGAASVSGTWDVHISNINAVKAVYSGTAADATTLGYFNQTSGTPTAATTPPVLGVRSVANGALSANFNVLLNEPGDYAIYEVTVVNAGSIDAILSSAPLTFTSSTDEAAGATLGAGETAQQIFTYHVLTSTTGITDAASIKQNAVTDLSSGATTLTAAGGASSTVTYYVAVIYNDTALEGLPSSEVDQTTGAAFNTSSGTLTLNYEQD